MTRNVNILLSEDVKITDKITDANTIPACLHSNIP